MAKSRRSKKKLDKKSRDLWGFRKCDDIWGFRQEFGNNLGYVRPMSFTKFGYCKSGKGS